jgi:hypothetical protein
VQAFGTLIIAGIQQQHGSRYTLTRAPKVTVETRVTGEREVFPIPAPGPATVVVNGEGRHMSVQDAQQIMALQDEGSIFAATFPGLAANGGALTWNRCLILDAPDFKRSAGGEYVQYAYSIILL